MGAKMASKSTNWRQNNQNSKTGYAHTAFFFVRTQFSRNHTNPRAVGTSLLLKDHFCRWRLANVLFSLRFFVFVFIKNKSITFLQKTLVNAQPLSCPFFEEFAAHKKNVFSRFCVCVCVFLLFHIYVDFRVPLADALGQIGSILD